MRTASEVRESFSAYLDDVIRKSPQSIKRHRDSFITLSPEHIDALLDNLTFTLTYDVESDGSVSGSLEEVGLSANAPDLCHLKEVLSGHLLEYAKDYMEHFTRYFLSPNRRSHFPYIMKAIVQANESSLRDLFKDA